VRSFEFTCTRFQPLLILFLPNGALIVNYIVPTSILDYRDACAHGNMELVQKHVDADPGKEYNVSIHDFSPIQLFIHQSSPSFRIP